MSTAPTGVAAQMVQPEGPYFLLGDCSGGPEAYETARQLSEQNATVALLLLETRGPYVSRRYWGALLGARLIDHVLYRFASSRLWRPLNYLRISAAFHLRKAKQLRTLDGWRYLLGKAMKSIPIMLHRSAIASSSPSVAEGMGEEERLTMMQMAAARAAYRQNWRWPYKGRIALVVSSAWYGVDSTFGWADVALDGVEVHTVPGNHDSYMLEHDRLIAEKLSGCMERFKNSSGDPRRPDNGSVAVEWLRG